MPLNPRKLRRGFTMLELMFVLVVLGVLFSVALPKMSGTRERTALQTTVRDMAKLAAVGRQISISQQVEVDLVLDPIQLVWHLELVDPNEDDGGWRRQRSREPRLSVEQPQRLEPTVEIAGMMVAGREIEGDPAKIRFYPSGGSTGGTFVLRNRRRGGTMTLEIEAATGRSSAYDGEPRTFAQKLEDLGLDPRAYGEDPSGDGVAQGRQPGDGFYRIGQSSDERVQSYSDAAARIMGNVTRQYEREQNSQNAPR